MQPAITYEMDKLNQSYNRDGYIILPAVFSASEQRQFKTECERLSMELCRQDNKHAAGRKHDTLGFVMDRLDPVIDVSSIFKELSRDQRIVAAASALLGEPAALFKDKLITKPPGTHGYDVHQDYPYWESIGLPADEMLTAWVAIDDSTEDNGGLEIFPGQHRARIPGMEDSPLDVDEKYLTHVPAVLVRLQAGDLMLFHSLAPHRSAPNRSPFPRRALLFTYVPERHGPLYRQYYRTKFH